MDEILRIEGSGYVEKLERAKRTSPKGIPYWMARDLLALLGYSEWRNFDAAIQRARAACASAGHKPDNHFVGATAMVEIGSGAQRAAADYFLTRYACYLLAMTPEPGAGDE